MTYVIDKNNDARVAQLDRVPGYEPGGRRFESSRAHHYFKPNWVASIS